MRFILVKVGTCQERNPVCDHCAEPDKCGCLLPMGHKGMCLSTCGVSWDQTGQKVSFFATWNLKRRWDGLAQHMKTWRNRLKSQWLTEHGF